MQSLGVGPCEARWRRMRTEDLGGRIEETGCHECWGETGVKEGTGERAKMRQMVSDVTNDKTWGGDGYLGGSCSAVAGHFSTEMALLEAEERDGLAEGIIKVVTERREGIQPTENTRCTDEEQSRSSKDQPAGISVLHHWKSGKVHFVPLVRTMDVGINSVVTSSLKKRKERREFG